MPRVSSEQATEGRKTIVERKSSLDLSSSSINCPYSVDTLCFPGFFQGTLWSDDRGGDDNDDAAVEDFREYRLCALISREPAS